jgi:cobalt/nickel transport protein
MDRRYWGFIFAALGVTVILAVLVAPFASKAPDGLERVIQDHGLAAQQPEKPVWDDAPLSDFKVPGVEDEKKAISIAAAIGLVIMFGGSYAIAKLMIRAKRRDDERTKP